MWVRGTIERGSQRSLIVPCGRIKNHEAFFFLHSEAPALCISQQIECLTLGYSCSRRTSFVQMTSRRNISMFTCLGIGKYSLPFNLVLLLAAKAE